MFQSTIVKWAVGCLMAIILMNNYTGAGDWNKREMPVYADEKANIKAIQESGDLSDYYLVLGQTGSSDETAIHKIENDIGTKTTGNDSTLTVVVAFGLGIIVAALAVITKKSDKLETQ